MKRLPPDLLNWLLFAGGLALIGWVEISRPGGLDFSDLTGGLVTMDMLVRTGILTIVLVGLNLLMGYAGQASLGHAAFYGMGAYISAIFTVKATSLFGWSSELVEAWWWPWLVLIAGMLFSAGLAYVIGRPLLRLRGHYLAMATLGLGVMVYVLFRENLGFAGSHITGSFDGIPGLPRLRLGTYELWPIERYYVMVWLLALLVIAGGLNLIHSRSGRALRAIHSSPVAAEALGVDVAEYKAQVFALSAAMASLGGSLYAHFQAAVSPAPFSFVGSLELVVMSAVGGIASIWGAPFGVAIIYLLKEVLRIQLRRVLHGASGEQEVIFYGLLLVIIMIVMPEGITAGLVSRMRAWRRQQQKGESVMESAS